MTRCFTDRRKLNLSKMKNKFVYIVALLCKVDWKTLILIAATTRILLFLLPFPLLLWLQTPATTSSTNSSSQILGYFNGSCTSFNNSSIVLSVMEKTRPAKRRRRQKRKNSREEDDLLESFSPPTPPTPLQRYIWSLSTNEALLYAKKELNYVNVSDEDDSTTGLYPPVFKNVTLFKRSYELMELILKVYIYEDEQRPMFHQPHLNGIYASEGWFMKLLEENKKFVTKDPEKAHLFYLPYSVKQMQQNLHVPPGSHNNVITHLSYFLRDYVNSLSAKYPFWNRTRGSDHFLVACHDWGPYTLKEHNELLKNTIKALCNADLSEGIFDPKNDVSLPETTIRTPRKPHRNIGGGLPVSQRPFLAFFAGNMHGRVRPTLLKHWHNKDTQMKIFGPLPGHISKQMSYIQHMKSSKFCICPMGFEVNSPRIVEAIYYECLPVIIADNFVPPFDDVFDWSKFSVIVAEKDIPKLKDILEGIPLRDYLIMLRNLKMIQRHFLWNSRPVKYDLFHMVLHSIWARRLNQVQIPGI